MYYDLSSPVQDTSTGRVDGRTTLSPITVVKRVDQISPLLQDALRLRDRIDAQISVLLLGVQEAQVLFHKYTLVDARITGIRVELPAYGNDSSGVNAVPLERVTILPRSFINESTSNGAESTFTNEQGV